LARGEGKVEERGAWLEDVDELHVADEGKPGGVVDGGENDDGGGKGKGAGGFALQVVREEGDSGGGRREQPHVFPGHVCPEERVGRGVELGCHVRVVAEGIAASVDGEGTIEHVVQLEMVAGEGAL
jgi:hypothetical protein